MATNNSQNLQRDTLRKIPKTGIKGELASLRLAYSEDSKLLTGYVNRLVYQTRVHPKHLPTQKSFRWSTINPPITNWPRRCINPNCNQDDHEWTDVCWSVRDILLPDSDEILVSWDHDNIEGKIHDLIVNDQEAIKAHIQGYDLHTITCCNIFGYEYPPNMYDPHGICTCSKLDNNDTNDSATSSISGAMDTVDVGLYRCMHCLWREKYRWQGKDTKQRVMAKNFNHGSKYTTTWRFVYKIPDIEKYGVSRDHLGKLAKRYIESKGESWQVKLDIMEKIRKDKIVRTLYGARRVFFDSGEETGREGFSHMVSGTVSDYNNETLILLEKKYGDNVRMLHNAHDGDKVAFKTNSIIEWGNVSESINKFRDDLKQIIQRPITYRDRSLIMTAGIKVHI